MAMQDALVWVDLEMTGLDPDNDRVIEIATIVTNSHLEILAEGPVLAIHQSEEVLAGMDDWNQRQHGHSGLLTRVRASTVTEAAAERMTIDFLARYIDGGKSPMCGNSVCQDRRFMVRHLPQLEAFFHYRNLDVSTIKELARRWRVDVYEGYKKKGTHLALDDIRESIHELRHYRSTFFRMTP